MNIYAKNDCRLVCMGKEPKEVYCLLSQGYVAEQLNIAQRLNNAQTQNNIVG